MFTFISRAKVLHIEREKRCFGKLKNPRIGLKFSRRGKNVWLLNQLTLPKRFVLLRELSKPLWLLSIILWVFSGPSRLVIWMSSFHALILLFWGHIVSMVFLRNLWISTKNIQLSMRKNRPKMNSLRFNGLLPGKVFKVLIYPIIPSPQLILI